MRLFSKFIALKEIYMIQNALSIFSIINRFLLLGKKSEASVECPFADCQKQEDIE